ncbi:MULTISPECIES: 4-hydroxy-3-methylbut-2-enyl diphosphate reductase [Acidithrix]|nr:MULTISPECIES: 4-hydroxy-3-methylbut-2-enyl diphosphate reductase [Acidithrix]CAG4915176.1 unnamed protein product [Acidithrix sp. C25]
MAVEKVLLAKPRGFCAGVEMAIKALSWMVRVFDPPVYCYHEIVHNKIVVDRFLEQGVIFVDDPSDVPNGAPIMLSAHGSAPSIVESSRSIASISINAVCPLVTKVHHEVKTRANKGFEIIYIGHHGHDEALGTKAVAPENVKLIETIAELEDLTIESESVALIAQTTLALDEWREMADRASELYPSLWMPGKSDLCFATTNRQSAIRHLAPLAQTTIIIGSQNSSNTIALEKVAKKVTDARVLRVNSASELPDDIHGVVAITAGASAPEDLIQKVIERLAPIQGVEEVAVVDEDEYFPPPRELREFLRSLTLVSAFVFGAPKPAYFPLDNDSSISASSVIN